ncbi:uncharacterized protein JCM6883_002651 [Sporobolomyces salmoneus]|uniref:uncharacterized protein n=1 Tax=Sporobolomyces salmoneus TaxID=183962 RepID=UPI00316F41C1
MATSNSRTQLLTPSSLRLDSRLPLELRSLSFEILPAPLPFDSLHSPSFPPALADGFAKVSHGLTTVTSSVFGPRESLRTGAWSGQGQSQSHPATGAGGERGNVNVEVGSAAWGERVSNLPSSSEGGVRKGGKDRRTVELASAIKNTFEPVLLLHLYPRSSIDIYLQILESDGSVLQAAINATTLALISAGLPLSDYICSVSLASYPSLPPLGPRQIPPFVLSSPSPESAVRGESTHVGSGSTVLLDLLQVEEQSLPNLTVAVLPRSGKVTLVNLETRVGVQRFEEMLRWGIEGGKIVQGAMEEAVRNWAESLARPSKTLTALFPGMAGGEGKAGGDEDEDMGL